MVGRGPYRGGGQPAFIAAEAAAVARLDAIPGVSPRTAETIVAELGCDTSRLPTLNAQRLTRYHTNRLAALGYVVTLTKSAAGGGPQPNLS